MYLLPFPHLIHRYLFAFPCTTLFGDSFSPFFSRQKSTFLSASAWVPHNLSIPPLNNGSWLHIARLRTLPLSLSWFTVSALTSSMKPSSNIAPAYANSSAFSLPSATNLSNCVIFSFCFFVRCAFTCATSTKMHLFTDSCNSSQMFIHRSASQAPGLIHSFSNYALVVHMDLCGSTYFPEEAQESCQLRPLDGAQNLVFCLHWAIHPVQGPQFFVTTQPHAPHLPALPSKEPSVATWPLKPSAGMLQLLCFSASHFLILKWNLFHWLPLRGCSTIPLCHFHSFFEVLAFCSNFLKTSGISHLTSYHSGQWYSLCFSVHSSFWRASHWLVSDQPTSNSLFCVHPTSKKIFLATSRCFSVQFSFTFLRKRASPGSSHAPSFNSSYPCFAAHFFQYTDRALHTSIF